jgi:hypothetical protein
MFILFFNLLFSTALATSQLEPVKPEQAKKYISDILRQPEFQTTREEYRWRYIGDSAEEKTVAEENSSLQFPGFISITANVLEVLLWILLGLGLLFILRQTPRWLEKFHFQTTTQPTHIVQPRILSELFKTDNLSKSSSLSRQAWAIWQAGHPQAAISLLYRGALSILTSRDKLAILDSTTERESVRLVARHQASELSSYFSELTGHWQNVAYAQRVPTEIEVQRLCKEWAQYFEV